jgi:solute carrier family 25 (mitochondrial carrier protein), member 16
MSKSKKSEKHSAEYILKTLLAGSIAGSLAKTSVGTNNITQAPLDRVKILFQTTHPSYSKYTKNAIGPFLAMADIYKSEGIMGLFRYCELT